MEEQVLVYLMSLCICFITVTATEDSHTLSPVGPRMCERFCQGTVGCTRIRYSYRYLSCHFKPGPGGDKEQDASYLTFNITQDKRYGRGKSASCPSLSLIFQTKQNRQICRQKFRMQAKPSDKKQMPRFLFTGRMNDIKQLFLVNNTVADYIKDSEFEDIIQIAYIERSRKLLFIDRGRKLVMSELNGKHKDIVSIKTCEVFCVTENKIFVVFRPRTLVSISHFGNNKTILSKSILNNADQMAADLINRLLFLKTRKNKLAIYDHFGVKQQEFAMITAMYIEPYSNWCYYTTTSCYLSKMSLDNGASFRTSVRVTLTPRFCVYRDIVYIFSQSSIKIFPGRNNEIDIIDAKCCKEAKCCFIP